MTALRDIARQAHANGLCLIPAAPNGTKQPWPGSSSWDPYKTRRPTPDQHDRWFSNGRYDGLGIVCGHISGNLEMLEFEGRAIDEGLVKEIGVIANDAGLDELWARVATGYRETTPSGGVHLLYRVDGPVAKNTKLARRPSTPEELAAWKAKEQGKNDAQPDPEQKVKRQKRLDQITRGEQVPQVLIETRGEGGFVVIAPSGGRTHPSGGAWAIAAGGFDTIPIVTPDERDALHALATALDQMPPTREEPTQAHARAGTAAGDELRPGDDYNNRVSWDEIIIPDGWAKVSVRGAVTYWRRPGKDRGVSATTGRNGADNFYAFTTSTVFEAETPYSKFAAYALLTEGAVNSTTLRAAAKTLRDQGYGSPRPVRQQANSRRAASSPQGSPDASEDETEGGSAPGQWEAVTPPVLPEEFWASRPYFEHIRQAAYSRLIAPDGVFAAVLMRGATALDHRVLIPPIVGRYQPPSLFGALVAISGGGKGASLDQANELFPFVNTDHNRIREASAGSGEGMVKKFFRKINITDSRGKITGSEWKQDHHALFVRVDEGTMFSGLANRRGQTTIETLRQAWSGERLGGSYADEDRGQQLAPHTYRLCLALGIQPETAGILFEDAHGGLPQRFVWLSVQAPNMPALDAIPEHPGPLPWVLPSISGRELRHNVAGLQRCLVEIAPEIVHEVRLAHVAQVEGRVATDGLDGHANLSRLKVATVLSALDGRLTVTVEDWEIAGLIIHTSNQVRTWIRGRVSATEAAERNARNRAHAEREVLTEDAKEKAKVLKMAKRARRYVLVALAAGELVTSMQKMNRSFAGGEKHLMGDALEHALRQGWIRRCEGGFALGDAEVSS